eukprot:g1741.t1
MEDPGARAEATVIADYRHNASYLLPDLRAGVLFLYSPMYLIMNAYMAFLFAVMVFNVQVTSAVTGGYFASLSACWITVQYVTFAHQEMSSALYVNGFAAIVLLLFWITMYYPAPRSFVRLRVLCRAGLTFLFYANATVFLLGDNGFLWLLDRVDSYEADSTEEHAGDKRKTKSKRKASGEEDSSDDGADAGADDQAGKRVFGIDNATTCSTARQSEPNNATRRAYLFRVKYWGYYLFYFYKIAFGRRLLFRAGWGWLLLYLIAKDVVSHILHFAVRILEPCIVLHAKLLASEQLSKRRPWLCGFVRWWDDSPLSEWLLGGWTYHYDLPILFKDTGCAAADRNEMDEPPAPAASLVPPNVSHSLLHVERKSDDADAPEKGGDAASRKPLLYCFEGLTLKFHNSPAPLDDLLTSAASAKALPISSSACQPELPTLLHTSPTLWQFPSAYVPVCKKFSGKLA